MHFQNFIVTASKTTAKEWLSCNLSRFTVFFDVARFKLKVKTLIMAFNRVHAAFEGKNLRVFMDCSLHFQGVSRACMHSILKIGPFAINLNRCNRQTLAHKPCAPISALLPLELSHSLCKLPYTSATLLPTCHKHRTV